MRVKLLTDLTVKTTTEDAPSDSEGTSRVLPRDTDLTIQDLPRYSVPVPLPSKLTYREAFIVTSKNEVEALKLTIASQKDALDKIADPKTKIATSAEPTPADFNMIIVKSGQSQTDRVLAYRSISAPAFHRGVAPKHTDVVQGTVGSCYLLAAAAASVVPHGTAGDRWRPLPLTTIIKPLGVTNSMYEVTFVGDAGPFALYISSSVPVDAADTGVGMAGAVPKLVTDVKRELVAWPALLEKAWVQWKKSVSSSIDIAMKGLGLSEVSLISDLSSIPDLFAQGWAIALAGNNHAYYVAAAADNQVTIMDQRTAPENRTLEKARAVRAGTLCGVCSPAAERSGRIRSRLTCRR
jgi:hypothetical protein